MRALVLCALAACTYPDKELDGPFTCFGAQPATTADPVVKLSGTTVDPSNLMPTAGVTLMLQSAQMSTIFTTTTDAMGAFTFTLNTNGIPVAGVDLFASAIGRINTYYFPSRPISHDVSLVLSVISTSEASALAAGAGITNTAGDGTVLLTINDCNDAALAGAKLTSAPAGPIRYFDGIQPSMTATATDAGGVAMIANLPPGKATLNATVAGMTLPPHDVTVVANAFSLTEIQP